MFLQNKIAGRFFAFWVFAGLCCGNVYADTFNGFVYTTNSTSATITNYTGAGGDLVIPETLGGKPVTKINAKVFYYETKFTSVTLPASITNVGTLNFASCFGMTSINVDTNNQSYSSDGGILFNKTKTVLVQCPSAQTGTYSVPAGVTNLGYSAFFGCSVTGVTLSASVSGIGISAFNGCTNLITLAVDTNNPSYSSDGGVLFNKTKTALVNYPTGRAGSYTIPSGVTGIGEYAFCDNREITSVDIPSSVTSIGMYAFYNCKGLPSVTLPSSITAVGASAFRWCDNLERTDFLGNAPGMGSSVFTNCAAGFTVYYLEGKPGFTSPTWNGYPSAALSAATILPPGLPSGMESEYEAWVLTNAPSWNAANFTALPPADFEKAWLINSLPESNMQAKTGFRVEQFSVVADHIRVTLGLDISAQPKTGFVNGWLAVEGRNSMTDGWQMAAGQMADQDKISFTNGQATVLFDKPDGVRFFRPGLQTGVPNAGNLPPLKQTN